MVSANAFVLCGNRPKIRAKHKSRRVHVYARQLTPPKSVVQNIQLNKRRAASRMLQGMARMKKARMQRGRTRPSSPLMRLSVKEQVGLVAALSLSHVGFRGWRLALEGARRGLTILSALRAARWRPSCLPGTPVVRKSSGTHLVSFKAAVQERVSAPSEGDKFVERPVSSAFHLAGTVDPRTLPG